MPLATGSPHRFHIPVMGSGFTIDTPIKVAPWGIDSVISLVDDDALEVTRAWYLEHQGAPSSPIRADEPRARQRDAWTAVTWRIASVVFWQAGGLNGSAGLNARPGNRLPEKGN